MPWSPGALGARPAPEDVRNWGRGESAEGLRDWYPDARPARRPVDVLLCQRSIVTWARQDHATYADFLRWSAGAIFGVTLILGVSLDLTLGEYLLRLGIPVLPGCLDVLDITKANAQVAKGEEPARRSSQRAVGEGPRDGNRADHRGVSCTPGRHLQHAPAAGRAELDVRVHARPTAAEHGADGRRPGGQSAGGVAMSSARCRGNAGVLRRSQRRHAPSTISAGSGALRSRAVRRCMTRSAAVSSV